jgi:hypothetical protein
VHTLTMSLLLTCPKLVLLHGGLQRPYPGLCTVQALPKRVVAVEELLLALSERFNGDTEPIKLETNCQHHGIVSMANGPTSLRKA